MFLLSGCLSCFGIQPRFLQRKVLQEDRHQVTCKQDIQIRFEHKYARVSSVFVGHQFSVISLSSYAMYLHVVVNSLKYENWCSVLLVEEWSPTLIWFTGWFPMTSITALCCISQEVTSSIRTWEHMLWRSGLPSMNTRSGPSVAQVANQCLEILNIYQLMLTSTRA